MATRIRRKAFVRTMVLAAVACGLCTACSYSPRTSSPKPEVPPTIGLMACPKIDLSGLEKYAATAPEEWALRRKRIEAAVSVLKDPVKFGSRSVAKGEYSLFIRELLDSITERRAQDFISDRAECFGIVDASSFPVLVTGYFTPILAASHVKRAGFTAPLYSRPADLLKLSPSLFGLPAAPRDLRARVKGGVIVPFYSRSEIELQPHPIAELLGWVDPIDAFHAQTQGSCVLQFDDGKRLSLEYDDKNGHPYVAIGSELPIESPISWQKIEQYLRALPPEELKSVLAINPSYVFFRKSSVLARTASSQPAIAEHTIAVDRSVYPFGTVGILEPDSSSSAHIVVAHDSGGAITGAKRIDWYQGLGRHAAERAGSMRDKGRYYILVPRSN